LQKDLDKVVTTLPIQILGVNNVGYESGNASMTSGRKLPWLQATSMQDVWTAWKVNYRDVVILDGNNKVAAVYNLSANDLGSAGNYAALKQLFTDTANAK
jgi:hypothetical protein